MNTFQPLYSVYTCYIATEELGILSQVTPCFAKNLGFGKDAVLLHGRECSTCYGTTHVTGHMGVSCGQQVATCLIVYLPFDSKSLPLGSHFRALASLSASSRARTFSFPTHPLLFTYISPPCIHTYVPSYPVEEVRWRGSSALSIVLRPAEQSTYHRLLLRTP